MAILAMTARRRLGAILALSVLATPLIAQSDDGRPSVRHPGAANRVPATAPDLTTTPTLYTIGYAHLDTEWNWDYVATIGQYLPKTLQQNFALFEKYPGYVFNFS